MLHPVVRYLPSLSEQCPAQRYSFLLTWLRRFVRLAYLYAVRVVFDVLHERRINAGFSFLSPSPDP